MVPLASESIRVCTFSWFRRPLNNAVTLPVTTKPLNNKSTQTPTDWEADLDLDVKLGFDNTSQRFFFLLGGYQNIGKEHFPCIPLCSLLDFFPPEFPMPSFDAPFGNCLSCLGCFTVSPICSDYRHTEWTGCSSAWLYVANVDWHPPAPWATTSVLKVLCSLTISAVLFFYLISMACQKIPHITLYVPAPVYS